MLDGKMVLNHRFAEGSEMVGIPKQYRNCYGTDGGAPDAGIKLPNPELSAPAVDSNAKKTGKFVSEFVVKYKYWFYGTGTVLLAFGAYKMFGPKKKKA